MDVRVVKSNRTVKFSGGFANFMKINRIVLGNKLMFRIVAQQTFVVQLGLNVTSLVFESRDLLSSNSLPFWNFL